MNSSAVEHLVYTEAVGGSIPSSSIPLLLLMEEFISKLKDIENKLNNVSHQMQELREAIRGAPRKDEKLSVRESYEHPWYKYKREELIASGNYYEQYNDRDQGI